VEVAPEADVQNDIDDIDLQGMLAVQAVSTFWRVQNAVQQLAKSRG
jgi:hypothetical protein